MVSLLDPGIGGDGDSSPTLASVGTTRRNVYPPESGEASSREDYEPQLQADVTAGLYGGSVTVEWRFGSTKVAERTHSLDAYESRTFARRVSWDDLDAQGLVPGDYDLKARIPSTGETTTYGTMHLHERQTTGDTGDDGGDPGGGSPGSCPEGYYYDTAFGMCLPGDTDVDDGGDTGGDTGGDSGGSGSGGSASLLPEGFPTLPAVGPLTAEQTTMAAVVGVPLLVVLLK